MSIFNEYPYLNYSDLNLDFLLKSFGEIIKAIDDLNEWKNFHETDYLELKHLYDRVLDGDFPDSVKYAFLKWMRVNAPDIIGEIIKTVFFGITDSGYFVAYIPDSWKDIVFNTTEYDIRVADYSEYGHLTLSY